MNLNTFLHKYGSNDNILKQFPDPTKFSVEDLYNNGIPENVIWLITRPDVATDQDIVTFVRFCLTEIKSYITDKHSKLVIPLLTDWLEDPRSVSNERLALAKRLTHQTINLKNWHREPDGKTYTRADAAADAIAVVTNAALDIFDDDEAKAAEAANIVPRITALIQAWLDVDLDQEATHMITQIMQLVWIQQNIPYENLNID